MGNIQLETLIDEKLLVALNSFCKKKGLALNHFVEEAILDKLEEAEQLSDLAEIRNENFRPLDIVLNELKNSRKL